MLYWIQLGFDEGFEWSSLWSKNICGNFTIGNITGVTVLNKFFLNNSDDRRDISFWSVKSEVSCSLFQNESSLDFLRFHMFRNMKSKCFSLPETKYAEICLNQPFFVSDENLNYKFTSVCRKTCFCSIQMTKLMKQNEWLKTVCATKCSSHPISTNQKKDIGTCSALSNLQIIQSESYQYSLMKKS